MFVKYVSVVDCASAIAHGEAKFATPLSLTELRIDACILLRSVLKLSSFDRVCKVEYIKYMYLMNTSKTLLKQWRHVDDGIKTKVQLLQRAIIYMEY